MKTIITLILRIIGIIFIVSGFILAFALASIFPSSMQIFIVLISCLTSIIISSVFFAIAEAICLLSKIFNQNEDMKKNFDTLLFYQNFNTYRHTIINPINSYRKLEINPTPFLSEKINIASNTTVYANSDFSSVYEKIKILIIMFFLFFYRISFNGQAKITNEFKKKNR